MECLDDNALAALVEGRVEASRALAIARHLDGCVPCRELVAAAVASSQRGGVAPALLAAGAQLGRYSIVGLVGAGAMGVVYQAWDPALSRKVALKLLRGEADDPQARERLLREARLLAQVSHPHVIVVHDVGEVGGQAFLAMELVEGRTLGEVLRGGPRPSRAQVLALFCAAGEGLAAAHARGLVHRDFKPDNVLVGGDGRVRVTDFGLALAAGERSPPARAEPPPRQAAPAGTPAYMAPEQIAGAPATARSDQFSFCVALYEALVGARPFAGADLPALRASIVRGSIAPLKGAPARLERALRRGLAADPGARHSSMEALLRELRRPPLFTAARAAALALFLLLSGSLAWQRAQRATCAGAEAAWGEVWSPARREQARAALLAASAASGPFAFAAADSALQALGAQWIAMRTDACLATRARGEQSEQLLDLRIQCLDDRRREADALAALYASATPAVAAHAREAAAALTPLSRCADARALTSRAAPPAEPAAQARLLEAKALGARAKALNDVGEFSAAVAVAEQACAAAEVSGDKPALAQALFFRADSQRRLGEVQLEQAERSLHASAAAAIEGRDDGAAADAFTLLCFIRGFLRADQAEGEAWAGYARAALARLGGDGLREATLERRWAALYLNDLSRADEALRHVARARELFARAHAPEALSHLVLGGEAGVMLHVGRVEEAIALYRQVVEESERFDGPENPGIAVAISNLGDALVLGGRAPEAVPLLERAVALNRKGATSNAAYSQGRLAAALRATGRAGEALPLDRAAAEWNQRASGDSLWLAEALLGLGLDLLALGRAPEAREPLEHAHRICCGPGGKPDELGASIKLALARSLAPGERSRRLAAEAVSWLRPLADRYGAQYRTDLLSALAYQSAAR